MYPIFSLEPGLGEDPLFLREVNGDIMPETLKEVIVPGDEDHFLLRRSLQGDLGQEVITLIPLFTKDVTEPDPLQELASQVGDLLLEGQISPLLLYARGGLAAGLVGGEQFPALEGLTLKAKDQLAMGELILQVADITEKAKDDAGGPPPPLEVTGGMESPVAEVMAVNDHEPAGGARPPGPVGRLRCGRGRCRS